MRNRGGRAWHSGVGGHFEAEAPKLEAPTQVDVLADRQLLGEPAHLIEGPSAHGQVGTEAGGEESQLQVAAGWRGESRGR